MHCVDARVEQAHAQKGAFCEFENVGDKCVRRDPAAFRSGSGIRSGAFITARGTADQRKQQLQ